MYYLYLDKVLFPIAPEKVQTKVKGKNKTISLINEAEVNQIKTKGLTELSFDLLLPNQRYPFARYQGNFKSPSYYLKKLEALKNRKSSFKFKLIRLSPRGKSLFDTSLPVTLENYTITEDAKEGFDIKVSIDLKEYVEYGVTTIRVKTSSSGKKTTKKKRTPSKKKSTPKTYTVKSGDTLWAIARKYLGSGTKWKTLYNTNRNVIERTAKKHGYKSSATGHWIFPGTKLTIPKG